MTAPHTTDWSQQYRIQMNTAVPDTGTVNRHLTATTGSPHPLAGLASQQGIG
ncbi:MAG: hypothetical protein WBJ03_07905 [Moraxellaceae bacterium]